MTLHPNRRWFQFSMRALVSLMTVLSLPLGWLAYERNQVRKRQADIAEFEKLGGFAHFDESQPPHPAWLRPLLGDDSLGELVGMQFFGSPATNAELAPLSRMTRLQSLSLDESQVTDAGLMHLARLTDLRELSLDHTRVTDAGLVHLAGLSKLKTLWLGDTLVTDRGLIHL